MNANAAPTRSTRRRWVVLPAALLLVALAAHEVIVRLPSGADVRLALVERRPFAQVIRRSGFLQPANRISIFPKVRGTLLSIIADGSEVQEGGELFVVDPKPIEEDLTRQDASLRRLKADWERERQGAAKQLRAAEDELKSRELRVELETLRLKEITIGPSPSDELNARTNLDNARSLEQARREEYEILASLATDGFVSQSEARQKRLELTEQTARVADAELSLRKLLTPDPVKVAEQRLRVRDEEKRRDTAREKAGLLRDNLERATERFQMRLRREERQRGELATRLSQCRHLSPAPGVVLHSSGRRGWGLGPGREVWEGWEVMTVSDLRSMKVVLAVDEGRVAWVQKGQQARVYLGTPASPCLEGVVGKVAEKGRDEFEDLERETQELTGSADRQVFDVEVELGAAGTNLRPGQRVQVEITVQQIPEALVVPRAAVWRDGGGEPYVYVQARGGPRRRSVKVLAQDAWHCALADSAANSAERLEGGERIWRMRP
jgi:HlyD family secretion protein